MGRAPQFILMPKYMGQRFLCRALLAPQLANANTQLIGHLLRTRAFYITIKERIVDSPDA